MREPQTDQSYSSARVNLILKECSLLVQFSAYIFNLITLFS